MVGKNQTLADDSAKLRKVRKPLIEKKRRERINSSLAQLKDILTKNTKQSSEANLLKLDKADILEMTVRYLTQLQEQQSQTRDTCNYNRGFKDCTRETMRYLRVSRALRNEELCSLNSHLYRVYVAKTEVDNSNEIRSIPEVQKILSGNMKTPCRARSPGSQTGLSREDNAMFAVESSCLVGKRENSVLAVVKEEQIWRPW